MASAFQLLKIYRCHPHKAVRSHFVSPLTLAIIRSIWTIFCIIAVICKLIHQSHHPLLYVLYLTNLTFYGITAYMIVSTYLSWRYVMNPDYIPWGELHWGFRFPYFLIYEFNLLFCMIVTIVYWSLLSSELAKNPHPMDLYLSIAMHVFNLVICFGEGILSQNPMTFTHFPFIVVIALLYLPYAILLHHIHGIWPYFFLDYHNYPELFTIVILGIIVAALVFYTIQWKLHQLRDNRFGTTNNNTTAVPHPEMTAVNQAFTP